jgi:hypothetical protein
MMGSKRNDPWAALPGFEPYEPKLTDGFDSVDTQATDLASYLRAEVQNLTRQSRPEPITTVVLADGTRSQLIQRADDDWEVRVHLRRDFYRTFRARTRAAVLEAANEFYTSGTKSHKRDEQS